MVAYMKWSRFPLAQRGLNLTESREIFVFAFKPKKSPCLFVDLTFPETIGCVVIHDAYALHERIHRSAAHEVESGLFQSFRKCV